MTEYPFNRVFCMTYDSVSGEYFTSLTGQAIVTRNAEKRRQQELKEDYPLRAELEQLTHFVLNLLEQSDRNLSDVRRAALILRDEIWNVLDRLAQFEEDEDFEESDGEFIARAENSEIDPEDLKAECENDDASTLRHWWVYSGIDGLLEMVDESWLNRSELWRTQKPWTFPEIYMVLSLWEIDESVWYLNRREIGKSAVWAVRAQHHYDFALSSVWGADDEVRIRADLARNAADARHAETRAIKNEVFSWCAANLGAKTIDGAAEEIAGKVFNIKFRTAQKYISEYRRSIQPASTV